MEMVGTVPAANHVSLYCKIGKWGRGFHSRSCDSYGPWFRKDSIWIGSESQLPIWQSLRPYKDTVGQAECREVWLFSYISPFLTASFILWFLVPYVLWVEGGRRSEGKSNPLGTKLRYSKHREYKFFDKRTFSPGRAGSRSSFEQASRCHCLVIWLVTHWA